MTADLSAEALVDALGKWAAKLDDDREFAKDCSRVGECWDPMTAQHVANTMFAAVEMMHAAAARIKALDEDNARLRKPQFYWQEDSPETPWDNPYEYIYDYGPGEIVSFTTGNQTGEHHAVYLPAEDDAETDDNWEFDSPSKAEVHAALAAELDRRAARGGK